VVDARPGDRCEVQEKQSPHSVKDCYRLNPEFDSLDDNNHFVQEALSHSIYMILGWVANHTTGRKLGIPGGLLFEKNPITWRDYPIGDLYKKLCS